MKTRSLTEGAMLAAITVLLTVIGEYLGIPILIIPVPLALLVYRHGLRLGIITAFASAGTASLVAGQVFAGLMIIIWGFLGVSLGMALREKFSFFKTFVVGILADLVITGLSVFLYFLLFGKNLFGDMLEMIVSGFEQARGAWEGLGVTGEALLRYEQILETIPILMKWGLPALLLVSAVLMTYVNLAVLRLILRRMGDSIPWIPPFTRWRIPSFYTLFLLIGLLLARLGDKFLAPDFFQIIGLNLYLVFFPVYLVLGAAIVWYYFQTKNVPKFLRILFVFLLLSGMQLLVLSVVFLGILDGVFDFRKLKQTEDIK
ncbi:MAG: DUF2232 domain-containing protein [Firmicutes bacterium]|nr:DUF2232 domain-containing protein [Bacillota bacterium]